MLLFDCIFLLPLSENLASGASSAELRPTDDPSAEKTAELTQRVCPVNLFAASAAVSLVPSLEVLGAHGLAQEYLWFKILMA